jgi:hypothetical protein
MATKKELTVAELAARRLRGESLDKLADEIVMISNAVRKLKQSRLSEDTLYLLVQNAIGQSAATKYKLIPIKTIKAVVEGFDQLAEKHLKPKEPKK